MTTWGHHLAIDARPRGPHGLMAAEMLLGRSVLSHLVEQALTIGSPVDALPIHAREEDHPHLQSLIPGQAAKRVLFFPGPPPAGHLILRTDRLYDLRRLRRAVRRGGDIETAVIWRLDQGRSLASAEEEMKRRLTYQPLGRFWAFRLAEALAARLETTTVHPNHLTLAAAALMLLASVLVSCGGAGPLISFSIALALASALVLDTADGRLARLQESNSAFGKWLDQVLDELADVTFHAAIAWSVYKSSAQVYWLVIGMVYLASKYVFMIQSLTGLELEAEGRPRGRKMPGNEVTLEAHSRRSPSPRRSTSLPVGATAARQFAALAGHADVRWHLWIVLALLGRLDLALAAYAIYYPLRTLAGVARKAVVHA